jgi:hypothetical protein
MKQRNQFTCFVVNLKKLPKVKSAIFNHDDFCSFKQKTISTSQTFVLQTQKGSLLLVRSVERRIFSTTFATISFH